MLHYYDIQQNPVPLPPNAKIYWRVGGYALITSSDNKVLMVLPKYDTSKWMLPGGGINTHEEIAEGIKRECYEETGYKIKNCHHVVFPAITLP